MSEEKPRRRKSAVPPSRRQVKTSMLLDVELHARLSAAASLRGMSNNALLVEIVTEALRGLLIIDRRKSADRGESDVGRESAA